MSMGVVLVSLCCSNVFIVTFEQLFSYNQTDIYLFKVAIETLEKGVKYVQSYQ